MKITKSKTEKLTMGHSDEGGHRILSLEHESSPPRMTLTATGKGEPVVIPLDAEAQRELLAWLSTRVPKLVGSGDPL